MTASLPLCGVFAAAVTPLRDDYSPDLDSLPLLIGFLAQRGCHGVLVLGTTGEGPSFSPSQRHSILSRVANARQDHPHLRLLAGTGTPSLDETVSLTRDAFDLGYDGVVVLPPYYFRKAGEDGLFAWFSQVIRRAVPGDGTLLAYHIPPVSGINMSLDLFVRLKDAFPGQFGGLKDSSGDAQHALQLSERFGSDLLVFNGNDRLFSLALQAHAAGCITAMANIFSPMLRRVWEAHQAGEPYELLQEHLSAARAVLDKYPPMPPLLKALLAAHFNFPAWQVMPPLAQMDSAAAEDIHVELAALAG